MPQLAIPDVSRHAPGEPERTDKKQDIQVDLLINWVSGFTWCQYTGCIRREDGERDDEQGKGYRRIQGSSGDITLKNSPDGHFSCKRVRGCWVVKHTHG